MARADRIMIIGPSGSGKSTLAQAIGERLGLPVVHLDALYWEPGWVEADDEAFRARMTAAVAGDRWVTDGNYSRHMDLRLPRAQLVIFLDLPRSTYFPSAVWRSLRSRGRQRPDIGPGCVERFDPAFFRDWVWTYPSRGRPKAIALMAALPLGVRGLTFTSRRAVRRLIATLPGSLDGA